MAAGTLRHTLAVRDRRVAKMTKSLRSLNGMPAVS